MDKLVDGIRYISYEEEFGDVTKEALASVREKAEKEKKREQFDFDSIRLVVDEEGNQMFQIEGPSVMPFGWEFLKGVLEVNGISEEEFLEKKGWRLDD